MPELRFLHTADVHLGRSSPVFGERADAHRQLIMDAFGRCIDEAVARRAQLFLISGDLFDRQRPGRRAVQHLIRQLRRLGEQSPPIQTVILPGTRSHDAVGAGSVWTLPELRNLPPHVRLLVGAGARLELPDHGALIQGGDPALGLASVTADPSFAFNIGLLHASLERGDISPDREAVTVSEAQIAATRLNYLALGHWHGPSPGSVCGAVPAYYPGSPEILAMDQARPGQALFVTLRPGGPASVEPVSTGRLRRQALRLDVAEIADEADLRARLAPLADADLLLSVELAGIAGPDWAVDRAAVTTDLQSSFFRLELTDRSQAAVLSVSLDDYVGEPVTGRFVRLALDRIAAARAMDDPGAVRMAEQALQTGLALLRTGELP
jgi:DNA repair protein SbcD/Mre11